MSFQVALAEVYIQASGTLSDLYPGTTRGFTLTVTDADDDAVDISGDTMTLRIKRRKGDLDTDALVSKAASSMLATGVASFSLTPSDLAVQPGAYWMDVEWVTNAGAIYIAHEQEIKILTRVSDS